jgi:two-component system chemotaxis sensor kinase CheA
MKDQDIIFKYAFIDEAEEILSSVECCFMALEKTPDDQAVLDKIFRMIHTFKGTAGSVGFDDISQFTHQIENLLVGVRKGEHKINPDTVCFLLKVKDQLHLIVKELRRNIQQRFDFSVLTGELATLMESLSSSAWVRPQAPQAEENGLGILSHATATAPDGFTHELKPTEPEKAATAVDASENIRVNLARIDNLVNDVGELLLLQNVLYENRHQIPSVLLQRSVVQAQKITRKVQDTSMGLRLVPIKLTFQKMQRIIRDVAKQLGKEIRVQISGEETEIDKTILDLLADPLLHMVRNAVDHGICPPAERKAASKPEIGTITLRSYIAMGHNVIEVVDDGRGLDPQKIISKAVRLGLVAPGTVMSGEDAYQLILKPGFSTKEEVSSISGRGVGMDVVKTNIDRMKGTIEIESKIGEGTCFRILLPLTLAIIDAMIVKVKDDCYVIPLALISETVHLTLANINYVTGRGCYANIRGETIPLYSLAGLMGKRPGQKLDTPVAIVIRSAQAGVFALLADEITGQQQVVIKKLGEELKGLPGISGAAILGDGHAHLIIDPCDLMQTHKHKGIQDH